MKLINKQPVRKQLRKLTDRLQRNYSGRDYVIFWEGDKNAAQTGIFMKGGCDLPAIFTAVPQMRKSLNGTVAIRWHGGVSDSHTSLLLQSLRPLPNDLTQQVQQKLKLPPYYFQPTIFEPTFTISNQNSPHTFKKNVVIFSLGPDIVRTLYKHRESGLLVDPGGFWLGRSLTDIMANDMETALWFRKNFTSLGLIDVAALTENITAIVTRLKEKFDPTILILNVLTVEPGDQTYNYQAIKNPYELRRREFCYALVELSRKLDFYIVDVDRALKRAGLRESQIDFSHYPDEVYPHIGQEVFRILQSLKVLPP